MRLLYLIISSIVLVTSCNNNKESNVIQKAEILAKEQPTKENYQALVKEYVIAYESTDDKKEKVRLLTKALDIAQQQELTEEVRRIELGMITLDPLSITSGKILLTMAENVKANGNKVVADIMFDGIASTFKELKPQASALMTTRSLEVDTIISAIGQGIFNKYNPTEFDKSKAFKYIDMCEAFALTHPLDSLKSADYLFKGAEMARSIRSYNKAMSLYDMIILKYPYQSHAASSLFIKGYLLESTFGKIEEAKETYLLFLERFPNDELADDVAILIDNLGQSDEALYNKIRKQN